jgi:DnaJ-class molecular chaperone
MKLTICKYCNGTGRIHKPKKEFTWQRNNAIPVNEPCPKCYGKGTK